MINVMELLDAEEANTAVRPASFHAAAQPTLDASEGVRFEIDRGTLKVLLEKAIEVVPSKDIIPVLKNFQFRLRAGKLFVVSSNLSTSIIASTGMSLDIQSGGVEVFPAKKLLEIVRESDSNSRVYVEVTGRAAVVVAGNASWEVALGKGHDFPTMPKVSPEDLQEVDRAEFLRCLSTVKYAVGGSGRESLEMVNVKSGRFTACDGSRLQQARMPGLRLDMKIPGQAIDKLIKMLKGSDLQSMQVGEVKHHLIFRVGADTLLVNKTDSTFPPLEQLWLRPALSNDQKLRVEKTLLLDAIRRVKVNVDLEYSAISVQLTAGAQGRMGELVISASDSDNNRATEAVPALWEGKKRELVLHFRYLKEMLHSYEPDECLFLLGEDQKTKKSPVLLKDEITESLGIVQQMVGVPIDRRQGPAGR